MPGPRPPEGARRLGLLTILLVLSLSASASAATVPAGFTDAQVTAVGSPTALAFTPDGRMLIATQPGKVRLHKGGELLATPALDLGSSVCFRGERGLLGIAVDPEFAVNHFIYAFATRTKSDGTCVNRVSRFVMAGDVAALSSEVVLFDNIHSDTERHARGRRPALRQRRLPVRQRGRRILRLRQGQRLQPEQRRLPRPVRSCSGRSCGSPATGRWRPAIHTRQRARGAARPGERRSAVSARKPLPRAAQPLPFRL